MMATWSPTFSSVYGAIAMLEWNHQFYCPHCRTHLYGGTASQLAAHVNNHNASLHPSDFCMWTDALIVSSTWYAETSLDTSSIKPSEVKIRPAELTEYDKKMLDEARIIW